MEIEEIKIDSIKDLIVASSSFFLPTRKDGFFDAYKFCQKFEAKKILKLFSTQINNQIIGYISLILDPENNFLDIGPMFILKNYRGKGYGQKQVEFVITWAKLNNYKTIETRTWGNNLGSRKIFNSLNFIQTKEIKNDRIDGDSSIFFELSL